MLLLGCRGCITQQSRDGLQEPERREPECKPPTPKGNNRRQAAINGGRQQDMSVGTARETRARGTANSQGNNPRHAAAYHVVTTHLLLLLQRHTQATAEEAAQKSLFVPLTLSLSPDATRSQETRSDMGTVSPSTYRDLDGPPALPRGAQTLHLRTAGCYGDRHCCCYCCTVCCCVTTPRGCCFVLCITSLSSCCVRQW